MLKVVQGMGKTVPGPDGWRIYELKLLGLTARRQRARIVAVQMMEGQAPASCDLGLQRSLICRWRQYVQSDDPRLKK